MTSANFYVIPKLEHDNCKNQERFLAFMVQDGGSVMKYWYSDKEWWKKTLDRALRSLAQGILVGIGECVVMWDINWNLCIKEI